jgi:hypothetical protein
MSANPPFSLIGCDISLFSNLQTLWFAPVPAACGRKALASPSYPNRIPKVFRTLFGQTEIERILRDIPEKKPSQGT